MIKYMVTAKHISPRYTFTNKIVTAKPAPGRDGYWYAVSDGLGCSKDYNSAERAARSLFEDAACTQIQIMNTADMLNNAND